MNRGALLFLALGALPAVGVARPVRNSFVNHKVTTVPQLLNHIRTDREVADRYERHFAMDRASVLRYVGTLHRGRLAQPGVYTIYSVPDDGRLKMHVGTIKKGEPMFFDAKGQPVLVVKCGNPVVLGPKRVRRSNPLVVARTAEPAGLRTLTAPGEIAGAIPGDAVAMSAVEPSVPAFEASIPTSPAVSLDAPAVVGASSALASPSSLGLAIPFLANLPIVFREGDHRGQPVPEPATVVALATGAVALLKKRRRK